MDVSAARNRENADGGPALFRLVRFWSRRWINQARTDTAAAPDDLRQVQHIQVVEAIAAGRRTSDEATVSTVAEQLGVDHSGASRMVRDAAAAGYLTRIDSAHDRRRVVLELTADGRDLLTASRDWQRRCFDRLTVSWPERDRRQFATYLQRLADEATHNGAE